MAERDRPVYCTQCGSIVQPGNNFCGACGARVSPNAQITRPTLEIPRQNPPPRKVPAGARGGAPALIVGLGVVVVLLLGVGTIFGLALLRGESESRSAPEHRRVASQRSAERENEKEEKATAPQPAEEENLRVGDSVEDGGVRATLNDVRVLPTTVFDSPVESPDNIFVATDMTFENVSDEPLAISSLLEFVLKNGEGYSASQTMHTQQRQLSEGEISPGQKMSGEIVYEVPPDSRGLQLDYRPFLREDTHTWYIGAAESLPKVKAPQAEAPQTKAAQTASSSASAAQDPPGSESELIEAAVNYYQAVDQEDWAYTYDNLDSQTRSMFTEQEWYAKNKWYAENEGLELSTINVVVDGPTSEPVVSVTINRTFTDGTSITRDTLFVSEGGLWKHRFSQEEIGIFMPGVPYERFVAAQ
jgi:Domain of unknown function (DUF4352)/zinc-ribbon domain